MSQHPKISVRGLYKVFGAKPAAMMPMISAGMGKAELLARHNHVVGLHDINVDMQQGEITVIMGLSGSGKSTLLRHLNGLIKPTAGAILLDGEDVAGYPADRIRDLRRFRMSMVFQNFGLMPHMRVLQNVALGRKVRGDDPEASAKDAMSWIERLGLKGFENHYPHQLSGGMQQRVGIARALTSDSDVLLMDEAFSALDPLIRTDMQNLLLDLQKDLAKTIVFITHDLDESLRIADRLVILKDGIVEQQGDPQDIILSPQGDYVRRFVNDVNRGRVLRAETVMLSLNGAVPAESVDVDDTLETLITRAGGDAARSFMVRRADTPVGVVHMTDVFKALVRKNHEPADA